jgi:hypothetical protein
VKPAQPELFQPIAREPRETVDSGQLRERLAAIEAAGGRVESMERKPGSAVWTLTCNWARVCTHCRWYQAERSGGWCLAHGTATTAAATCPAWLPDALTCEPPQPE